MVRPKAFLLMPFASEFDWLRDLIVAAGDDIGVDVQRADDIFAPGVIIDQVRSRIESAEAILAVCSGRNANVFYELGIAESLHRPILIAATADDLPFDVRHFRAQCYGGNESSPERASFRSRVSAALQAVINDRNERPRTPGLLTHLNEFRMIGERTAPALLFKGIWFENLDRLDQSVQDISVRLITPAAGDTRQTLWREAGLPRSISPGCNIPARGRSPDVDIIAFLDAVLPTAKGDFTAEVAALGPRGAPGDALRFRGKYEIADS